MLKLTETFPSEEIYELNFSQGRYHGMYSNQDRVSVPKADGTLEELKEYFVQHVHPEEQQAVREFMDLEHIFRYFTHGSGELLLKGKFHKIIGEGVYAAVECIILPLRWEENSDMAAICFVKDQEVVEEESLEGTSNGRDKMTGLYKRSLFFILAQEFLQNKWEQGWCLVALDIEHFKLFNEWFGQEIGDQLLADIGSRLSLISSEENGLAGYFGGDDFYIIMHNNTERIQHMAELITRLISSYGKTSGFPPAIGIYEISRERLSISAMCDKAQIAASTVKGNYRNRIAVYDASMMERMKERKKFLSDVQRGIENREFVFYVQPKCNLSTGKIVGLEALARWNHPEDGIMSVGMYIPILESTGLISSLDQYIWEEVCRAAQYWKSLGQKLIPISVNVSGVDIHLLPVTEIFKQLTEKYDIEPKYIGIEITESAYAEDFEKVGQVVRELQTMGFTVLMDDFGSGYSSLNMLKDIQVDVLKLDMKFLEMSEERYGRGINVLESIVRLANMMDIRIIAEGVETKHQLDFLKKLGCVYGQGYYFYRPMPLTDLQKLVMEGDILDYRGIQNRRIEHIYIRDLFAEGIISDLMINNILGAVAFYDLYDGKVETIRVNDQYCSLVGMNLVDMGERCDQLIRYIHPEDRRNLLECFEKAYSNPIEGARAVIRRKRPDDSYIWLVKRIFFLREKEGHRLFYGASREVIEKLEMAMKKNALEQSSAELKP